MSKKTIEAIVDGGNDYVIQVKGNQKELYQCIEKIIEKGNVIDEFNTAEKNKGRQERRRVRLYNSNKRYISNTWKNVNRIIEVVNEGTREKKKYSETHYYISSLRDKNASVFAKGIRSHWCIENQLHRVKDVIQNEDDCLIQDQSIAANLSLIKSLVITIFRNGGYHSPKKALERFRNRLPDCCKLIEIPYI